MKAPRQALRALAVVMGLLATFPLLASAAAPPYPTVVGRLMLDTMAPVDVDRDGEAVVQANGTVNVTIPGGFTVDTRVNLTAQVNNTDWFATVSPSTQALAGSGEFPFTVNITVPGRVASDAGAELFVAANISVVGAPPAVSRVYTATTPVPVVQYFGVALTAATPTSGENFTAEAGNTTLFSLKLQNLGNGRDSFELGVSNLAQLQGQGIGVSIPSPVTVAKGGLVQVNGNLTLPGTLTSGNFTLSLSALSTGAAAKGQSVSSAADKHFAARAPDETGGGGSHGGGGGGAGKGFLPGFDAAAALWAAALAGLALRGRLRRP